MQNQTYTSQGFKIKERLALKRIPKTLCNFVLNQLDMNFPTSYLLILTSLINKINMGEPEENYPYFLLYEAKHTYFY